jgi:hypothetical protein
MTTAIRCAINPVTGLMENTNVPHILHVWNSNGLAGETAGRPLLTGTSPVHKHV